MKNRISKFLILVHVIASASCLAQPGPVKVGSSPNNEDGDNPKNAYQKINAMFSQGVAAAATVTPQSFGAVGDGVADDTAAIQKAIDYVALSNNTPAIVFFPAGTYQINSTLVLRSNGVATTDTRKGYSLQGIAGKSVLNYTKTNGNCLEFRVMPGDSGHLNHVAIRDLSFIGTGGTNQDTRGIYLGYDMSNPRVSDAGGWDLIVENCKVDKFKTGVLVNNVVLWKILRCEIEGDWWTSVTVTNADTGQIKDCAVGDPASGVDNILPLTFTNLAAIETWLGLGLRVEGCEIGRSSRAMYNRSSPLVWSAGNVESVFNEFCYIDGAVASSFNNMRIAGVGDSTTNTTVFHYGVGGSAGSTINQCGFNGIGNARLIAIDDGTYAYTQPMVLMAVAGFAPARYNSSYFPLINNLTRSPWTASISPSGPDFSGSVTPGASPAPISALSSTLVASNSQGYIGTKVPVGQGFKSVRSTVTFQGDIGESGMQFFLNPNTLRYTSSGVINEAPGQAYTVTGLNNGGTITFVTTNSWANDTEPREMFIRLVGNNILTLPITNKVWIINWQLDALP